MSLALISVSDKTGLIDLIRVLVARDFQIISTGGTARAIREAGIDVTDISEHTGFPEMMEGRVKTLHPKVHGGLLYLRGHAEHEAQAREHDIRAIDLVVVNLYPFAQTIERPDVTLELAMENIDIGGPGMLRSAAKNYRSVTAVVDPADYAVVAEQIQANGETTPALRARLAAKVFAHTSYYDSVIATYLQQKLPQPDATLAHRTLPLKAAQPLRYGENPHQTATLYGKFPQYFEQLHGKELSYNNLIDLSAAARLIAEFAEQPTLAILKHTNPCGVGSGATLREAWQKAFQTDRQAPFGGIIVVNRELDLSVAEAIAEIFSEVIIAPSFAPDALALLQKKKNLRLMINRWSTLASTPRTTIRSIVGDSYLVQQEDAVGVDQTAWKVVTKRQPTTEERIALLFGWRVVKHIKSNAIVYTGADRTLGVGAGQMSRVDASKIAVWKAGEANLPLVGSVVASDAFFPFPDGLIAAAEAGATAIIQPGGSVRDPEVITAADERNMAMIFTGIRHFQH